MSNNQMISVPLELNAQQSRDVQRFHETCEDGQGYDVPKDRMKTLARIGLVRSLGFGRYELTDVGDAAVNGLCDKPRQPAEHHQGEAINLAAVATLVDDGDGGLEASWLLEGGTAELFAGMTLLVADNAPDLCAEDGSAQVYTHVDPAEVERLRVQLRDLATTMHKRYYAKTSPDFMPFDFASGLIGQIDNMVAGLLQDTGTLRTQLAEAHALLRECIQLCYERSKPMQDPLRVKIEAALSASAEPGAPSCSHCGDIGQIMVGRSGDANDGNAPIMEPCEDCDRDHLTDQATWKRRAIEAESKLRTYDPRVVELGAKAFGALLVDPTKDLVLTKCKLCDQLQADLTARDQRIDMLEQQVQLADHWLEHASFSSTGEPVEHTQAMRDEFRKGMIAAVFPDYVQASTHGRLNGVTP